MQTLTVTIVDFDQLQHSSDPEIIARFQFVAQSLKKGAIPKSVDAIAKTVKREPARLTIHLFDSKQRHICDFCFIPVPPFR